MIPVAEDINDKAEQGIVFCALALFADFSLPHNACSRAKAPSLLGYDLAFDIVLPVITESELAHHLSESHQDE
jgi:hypothetical protein